MGKNENNQASESEIELRKLLFIQVPPSEHQILSVFGINALEFPQIIIADMRITGILH